MSTNDTTRMLLLERLKAGHSGWPAYDELLQHVAGRDWALKVDGSRRFFVSGHDRVFADTDLRGWRPWLDWMPAYVPALYGMNASMPGYAGGYADYFTGEQPTIINLFNWPEDEDMEELDEADLPDVDIPECTYAFLSNESGNVFFLTQRLEVLHANVMKQQLVVIDDLDTFTRKCIHQFIAGHNWFRAYDDQYGRSIPE